MAQDRLLAETAIRAFTQVTMLPGFGLKAQPGAMSAKGMCRDLVGLAVLVCGRAMTAAYDFQRIQ